VLPRARPRVGVLSHVSVAGTRRARAEHPGWGSWVRSKQASGFRTCSRPAGQLDRLVPRHARRWERRTVHARARRLEVADGEPDFTRQRSPHVHASPFTCAFDEGQPGGRLVVWNGWITCTTIRTSVTALTAGSVGDRASPRRGVLGARRPFQRGTGRKDAPRGFEA
jgi:hypothetical protein